MSLDIGAHARATVGDGKNHQVILLFQPHRQHRTLRAEFDGIAQQIAPDMIQQILVSIVTHRLQFQIQFQILGSPQGLQTHHHLPQLLVQPKRSRFHPVGLLFQLGQHQNIAHQCGQPSGTLQNLFSALSLLLLGQLVILQQHGVALNGGQRRFKLVGHVGDKVGAQGLNPLQFLRHGVEALIGVLKLCNAALISQRQVKLAPGDLPGGLTEAGHRCEDHTAHQHGQHRCHGGNGHGDTQDQHCRARVGHIKGKQQYRYQRCDGRRRKNDDAGEEKPPQLSAVSQCLTHFFAPP